MSRGRSVRGLSGEPAATSPAAASTMSQTKRARSFSEALGAGWRLLTPAERVRGVWLTLAQVFEGGLDALAVGASLPLVAIVVQHDLIETNVASAPGNPTRLATAPTATREAVSRALARSSTLRTSSKPYSRNLDMIGASE